MEFDADAQDRLNSHAAAIYFRKVHGEGATAEAMSALRYAKQAHDQGTIVVFVEILRRLAG